MLGSVVNVVSVACASFVPSGIASAPVNAVADAFFAGTTKLFDSFNASPLFVDQQKNCPTALGCLVGGLPYYAGRFAVNSIIAMGDIYLKRAQYEDRRPISQHSFYNDAFRFYNYAFFRLFSAGIFVGPLMREAKQKMERVSDILWVKKLDKMSPTEQILDMLFTRSLNSSDGFRDIDRAKETVAFIDARLDSFPLIAFLNAINTCHEQAILLRDHSGGGGVMHMQLKDARFLMDIAQKKAQTDEEKALVSEWQTKLDNFRIA